ncbi:hypothetical protein GQ43DRAFT_233627 [Delitschia confertaspora ATCC 74209]|uniref:Uncharacterized protein n=1 Tax=Delitschia confertaspora ATCC 74209 TaxID=1513339 RepID=A0A9P4MNE5_9PLEO|nr:hypothetical protein GQ43DRAFT_233627 [Delitschia confertaspora ATCC 74209]
MPKEVLETVHQHWPRSQLCIMTREFNPLILASALLYRLEVSVPCQRKFVPDSLSYFRRLKDAILQSQSLRILSIDIHQHNLIHRHSLDSADRGPLNLPLGPSDRLPPLEQLTIKAQSYDMSEVHCRRLLQCMDRKRLRCLDFADFFPCAFFRVFRDQLPNLSSLGFGYFKATSPCLCTEPALHPQISYQISCIANHLDFTPALKELTVRAEHHRLDVDPWPEISRKHRDSLTKLALMTPKSVTLKRYDMNPSGLVRLPIYFPYLQSLELDLTMQRWLRPFSWDSQALSDLEGFEQLRSLRYLHISAPLENNGTLIPSGLVFELRRRTEQRMHKFSQVFYESHYLAHVAEATVRFWWWERHHRKEFFRFDYAKYAGCKSSCRTCIQRENGDS